ncbi:MAG: four helix bundle protein [Candidatus Sumerlaeia bacterium]|nr:four helix bundle protein [Candidatus Sumerlaeia bacterium]
MSEDAQRQDLRKRTKQYALRIIRLYAALPRRREAQLIGGQVLRAGTSVGAHYCEAYRSRSDAEFVSKMEGGLQELDESLYWLELLVESGTIPMAKLSALLQETNDLISIFVSCIKRVKDRMKIKTQKG